MVVKKTMPYLTLIEKGQEMVNEAVNEDIANELDPENQQLEYECQDEEIQYPDEFITYDYNKETKNCSNLPGLFKRVQLETIDVLNMKTRNLDTDQKLVIDECITYIKQFFC